MKTEARIRDMQRAYIYNDQLPTPAYAAAAVTLSWVLGDIETDEFHDRMEELYDADNA